LGNALAEQGGVFEGDFAIKPRRNAEDDRALDLRLDGIGIDDGAAIDRADDSADSNRAIPRHFNFRNLCHIGREGETNFDTYQILRMNEAPAIEVHIVQSRESPGGMGEPGTSAIVPAVTNVIFAATGKRLRKLPIDTTALKQPV
jgi:hypothetical protein